MWKAKFFFSFSRQYKRFVGLFFGLFVLLLQTACVHSNVASQDLRGQKVSELNRKANYAFQHAMLERAEPLYREIVTRQPNNADAYFMLGNVYLRMGQLDAAITNYQAALEKAPNDARIWYNLYLATIQQAINALESGLSRNSEESELYEQMQDQLNKLYKLHADQGE